MHTTNSDHTGWLENLLGAYVILFNFRAHAHFVMFGIVTLMMLICLIYFNIISVEPDIDRKQVVYLVMRFFKKKWLIIQK